MNQVISYAILIALVLAATIAGAWFMLMVLLGVYSDDLALRVIGMVTAIALFLNPKGVIELFLNKTFDKLYEIMSAALPGLPRPNQNQSGDKV